MARHASMLKKILLVSISIVNISQVLGHQSPRENLQKAIAVIEIAAQQDPWYAEFLRALLSHSNRNIADDCAREVMLIAHMALTHAKNMSKRFPLSGTVQEDLIKLFADACTEQGEITNDFRCAHSTLTAPYPPVFNPEKRPGSCVCYDLFVQNQATVNSLLVTGPAEIAGDLEVDGNLTIDGSLTVNGSIVITGTFAIEELIVTNDAAIEGNLTVSGTGTFSTLIVTGTEYVGGDLHVNGLLYTNENIPPNNIIYVQKSPITANNQFNSINAALAAIALLPPPGPTNTYLIKVTPGVFVESQIQLLPFVTLQGSGPASTVIQTASPNQNVLVGAANAMVRDLTITGATGTGFAGVQHILGGTFIVLDCYLNNNDTHISVNNMAFNVVGLNRCLIPQLSQFRIACNVQGSGQVGVLIDGLTWNPLFNALYNSFARATGLNTFLQFRTCLHAS